MRHAWLILTHGNFEILEKQLRFLDSENADFYIHADAKAAFDPERFRAVPEKSRVTFVKRHRISWGHFAMVEAELELLRAAVVPGGYDYYHLLSGVDVPVKTRAYIENYFTRAPGRNYVSFLSPEISRTDLYRVRFYYPLQRYNIRKPAVRRTLRNLSAALQLGFGADRTRRRFFRRARSGSASRTRSRSICSKKRARSVSFSPIPTVRTKCSSRRRS